MLGGSPISWYSRRQSMVATSTTEAEYIAASTACKEIVWLKRMLNEIEIQCDSEICLNVDSKGAIQ